MPSALVIAGAAQLKGRMRWPAAERQARAFAIEVLTVWEEFERKLIAWLPGGLSVGDVPLKAAPQDSHPPQCTCPMHFRNVKSISRSELNELRRILGQSFSYNDMVAFDGLFRDVLSKLFVGGGNVTTTGAVFNRWFKDVFQEGLDQSYKEGEKAIKSASPATRKWWAKYVSPVYAFNESSSYVRAVYADGFSAVTSSLTSEFMGVAMRTLAEGISAGEGWQAIAASLRMEVGMGRAGHWRMVVRTEMLQAYDKASRERYSTMGVQWLKFSPTAGACPICKAIREKNGGYYKPAAAPSLPGSTHPNCRCRYLPRWNVPAQFGG